MPLITSVSVSIVEDKPVVDENGEQWYRPSYAEVFDWLIEKRIYIDNYPRYSFLNNKYTDEWVFVIMADIISIRNASKYEVFGSWHEAANLAIEKALELIRRTEQ